MALKGMDGFDIFVGSFAGSDDVSKTAGFIQYPSMGSFAQIARPGRNDYGATLFVGSLLSTFGTFKPVFADRMSEFVFGIACKTVTGFSPPSDDSFIMAFTDSVSNLEQFIVQFQKSTGSILIWSPGYLGQGEFVPSGTLLYTSPPNLWTYDVWGYFEVHAYVHPTRGFIKVQYTPPNGLVRIVADLNNICTQAANTNQWVDVVQMGHPWFGTSDFFYDDMYVCDGTVGPGACSCNSFLGDVRVFTQQAIGTDVAEWTPLAKTNVEEINEIPEDGDASYNYSNTPGQTDRFIFSPFQHVLDFAFGVKIEGGFRKNDAGMREIQQVLKSRGVDYLGGLHSLPDSFYIYENDLWAVDPATGYSWNLTGLNGLAAGYKLAV